MLQRTSPKSRRCSWKPCGAEFTPRGTQSTCSGKCWAAKQNAKEERARARMEKAERVATRKALEKFKRRRDYEADCQRACNRYIRARDFGKLCICCDQPMEPDKPGGSADAGHWLSVGSAANLRFHTLNIHAQRKSCNRPGGTTRAKFDAGMIRRVGLVACDMLRADQKPRKYSIEQLQRLTRIFNKKARRQEKRNADRA